MSTRPPSPTASASVQVVVRLRPLNDREKKHGTLPVVSASTAEKTVTVIKGQGARQIRSNYRFDNVFTAFSSQEEVFQETLKPVIRDVLKGFESTVFAYGQTGTGKTHTMEGDLSNPEMHGVIPRSAVAIFKELESPEYVSKSVTCSFLEIYNEDLCDLLADPVAGHMKRPKLDIMEGKSGPFCRGLSETAVDSAEKVFSLMRKAQQQRQVGETNMNKQSSRSHCIFTLRIEAKKKLRDGSVLEVAGKLHCVDLAGSECAKSADLEKGNEGQASRERERLNINRSLLTLGRVVSMLKERQSGSKRKARIPYRDSKLTRILQESLGGRCKTCLIATVSPSVTAIEESMSTLNYAQAANGIVNKPVTTSFMTQGASSFTGGDFQSHSNGGESAAYSVEHWQEMECRLEYMQTQVEEAQNALARKHLQQQELVERAEQAEVSRKEAVEKYEEAEKQISTLEEKIQIQLEEYEALEQKLSKTEATLAKTVAVLEATQHTEICLTNEAKALISALKQSIQQGDEIYESLHKAREDSAQQRAATKAFEEKLLMVFKNILQSLDTAKSVHKNSIESLSKTNTTNGGFHRAFLNQTQSLVEGAADNVNKVALLLKNQLHHEDGILPSVAAMTDSTSAGLKKLNETVHKGDKSIRSSAKSAQEELSKAAVAMKERERTYMESSSDLLNSLENSVSGSKESLSGLVSNATNALIKHSEEASEVRKKIMNISADWKSSVAVSSKRVQNLSGQESRNVGKVLQSLAQQVQKQEEISKHLRQFGESIKENRSSHLGGIQSQANQLREQREAMDLKFERNKIICQQFMDDVLGGITNLLQSQMEKMTQHHEEQHAQMVSKNQSMVDSNAVISQLATTILDGAASSNSLLLEHAQCMQKDESTAISTLGATRKSLNELHSTSEQIASDSDNYHTVMTTEVKDAEEVATNGIDELKSGLCAGSSSLQDQLTSEIGDYAKDGLAKLTQSTKEGSAFVEEKLIGNMKSVLSNNIEAPTVAILETIREEASTTMSIVDTGKQSLESKASELNDTIVSLEAGMSSSTEEIKKRIGDHSNDVEAREEAMSQALTTHEYDMLDKISDSSRETSAGSESFVDFVRNVAKANEPVPTLAPRQIPTFNENLSSTPAESDILKKVSLHVPNELSGKENSLAENSVPKAKQQRSMPGESPLAVVNCNSPGSVNTLGSERSKRRGDGRRKEPRAKKPKTLRLSIPKSVTM